VLRFYGYGNDTSSTEDEDFYKVNANQFLLYPSFRIPFAGKGLLTLGPAVKYTQSDESKDQYINVVRPYGVGNFGEVALQGVLSWDGRDSVVFPRRGVFAAVRGTYFPQAWDVRSDFGQVNGNVNTYFTAGRVATLALREPPRPAGPPPPAEAARAEDTEVESLEVSGGTGTIFQIAGSADEAATTVIWVTQDDGDQVEPAEGPI